ncbi:MAG: helix-turn-helix domain-containing protein [Candidatus Staskawiczbacteria bacterium]|nr:helix-turn-helix domain-containing protein [Candidatus Staskawiczbacteria bacterium]
MKIEIRSKAIALRKNGKSYREISQSLKVSKGTLFVWFKNISWSKHLKKELSDKARIVSSERLRKFVLGRQKILLDSYEKAENEAKKEFEIHKYNPLFIGAIMLYWGEGDRSFKNGRVKMTNTDPAMIKIFRKFLLEIICYEKLKIKGWLLLYPDLNIKDCLNYWVKNTGIPLENFTKPTIINGKHKTHRLQYGVCTVSITNKYLKKKILTWIDLYKKEF